LPAESAKRSGGPYRKPRADVYTVLLAIALVALLLAILCLYMEMDHYQFKFKGGPSASVDFSGAVAEVARLWHVPANPNSGEFGYDTCSFLDPCVRFPLFPVT